MRPQAVLELFPGTVVAELSAMESIKIHQRPTATLDAAVAAAAAEKYSAYTLVIICANQRSGSSLTGEIFNTHPEVFYFYEPLISINEWKGGRAPWLPWQLRHQLSAQRYGAIVKKSNDLIAQIHTCNDSQVVTMPQYKKRLRMFVSTSKAIGQVLGCGNHIDEIR
ncbi:PREDICTED: carbohydrate sulfotransferase 7-like [Priapulus caudatus]|uniref:Carbohydrate sulfotransferase 7-like n=1 Tax=Priapulus caudatus TaxID=37621 RepID=A0ABM1DS69_PRICU|nr:PREDICTED: carbohydrate sulfotransferase 7-like [Priapulus caudatus]